MRIWIPWLDNTMIGTNLGPEVDYSCWSTESRKRLLATVCYNQLTSNIRQRSLFVAGRKGLCHGISSTGIFKNEPVELDKFWLPELVLISITGTFEATWPQFWATSITTLLTRNPFIPDLMSPPVSTVASHLLSRSVIQNTVKPSAPVSWQTVAISKTTRIVKFLYFPG